MSSSKFFDAIKRLGFRISNFLRARKKLIEFYEFRLIHVPTSTRSTSSFATRHTNSHITPFNVCFAIVAISLTIVACGGGGKPSPVIPSSTGAPATGVTTTTASTGSPSVPDAAFDVAIGSVVVDEGTTLTVWATPGSTPSVPVTSGIWKVGGPSPTQSDFKLINESAHFAFYSDEVVPETDLALAADTLENIVWKNLFDSNLMMPEPFFNATDKIKPAIHIHSDWGLTGGAWVDPFGGLHPSMWIGPGALKDHWGLTHEFTHGWQQWAAYNGGMTCDQSNTCGWMRESHANFTPHQLPEYQNNAHCTEMLPNAPHLYLGSSRDRYCNWQLLEFLKDKYGPEAVTQIWTSAGSDPLVNIQKSRGWTISQLNDFLGDWAMHNVVWDYKATPAAFRAAFGNITQADLAERMHRLMPLEALDEKWAVNQRFISPFYGSPQRFGYNVVRIYPSAGATTVSVKFRGVDQPGSDADFRWGLVATDNQFSEARYSAIHRGLGSELTFRVNAGEPLFMVVMATPSVFKPLVLEQEYGTIWRYPYMIELANAWPQGFQNGQRDACPTGTARHSNGGGCAPASTPATVYVGPYASVLPGGSVTGGARIEDEAIVANGIVSGGIVGGLSVIGEAGIGSNNNSFIVSGSAVVRAAFYPLGFFEAGQGASGSLSLVGDVEYRGIGLNLAVGNRSGFVDATSTVGSARDINAQTSRVWRP